MTTNWRRSTRYNHARPDADATRTSVSYECANGRDVQTVRLAQWLVRVCRLRRDATRSARVDLSNAALRRAQLRASWLTNQRAPQPPIFAVTF
jgi:hypothetical protein